mmetsp:Transcript_42413/g.49493  ORF Transcript_42413/g.49493 Transcript_42413/m.49493 type:complete len:151 (+) Transcript_42413:439-891(+)
MSCAKKNIRELIQEVMTSTSENNRNSVCHILEEEAEQRGVAAEEEFKHTGDNEPINQNVYYREYDLCRMGVQSASKIKNIEEDVRAVLKVLEEERKKNKNLEQKVEDLEKQNQLLKKQIEELKKGKDEPQEEEKKGLEEEVPEIPMSEEE